MSCQLNTYVDERLVRWAAWYHATPRPGPKPVRSQMAGILAKAGDGDGRLTVRFDAAEGDLTDRCVYRLCNSHHDLYLAVVESYLKGGTIEQKIKALHVERRTFYYRLERARAVLLGYFNDIEAGIVGDRLKKLA